MLVRFFFSNFLERLVSFRNNITIKRICRTLEFSLHSLFVDSISQFYLVKVNNLNIYNSARKKKKRLRAQSHYL